MTPGIFCCHPFKNGWKLAVLLLFSNFSASFSLLLAVPRWKTSCFAAIFKLFALLFSNCDEFQNFWKKLKFSEKIVNLEIFCCQPFKNGWKLTVLLVFSKCSASFSLFLAVPRYQKWRKTSGFAIFKLFALLFSNFDEFPNFFRNSSQKYFRNNSNLSSTSAGWAESLKTSFWPCQSQTLVLLAHPCALDFFVKFHRWQDKHQLFVVKTLTDVQEILKFPEFL